MTDKNMANQRDRLFSLLERVTGGENFMDDDTGGGGGDIDDGGGRRRGGGMSSAFG